MNWILIILGVGGAILVGIILIAIKTGERHNAFK